MTAFRRAAQRRGVVIAAIWPAKWKAGMQYVWVGAAYCWFAVRTLATQRQWTGATWDLCSFALGAVGVVTMWVAVALTIWSLVLYLQKYGSLFTSR